MSNISRYYPFQPQYRFLIDNVSQPEKTTGPEVSESERENARKLQAMFADVDEFISRMQEHRKTLTQQPALLDLLFEEITILIIKMNKALLDVQLAFFDCSGELVRKENREVTRRVEQLLDVKNELEEAETEVRLLNVSLLLTLAEQKALLRQQTKTPPA